MTAVVGGSENQSPRLLLGPCTAAPRTVFCIQGLRGRLFDGPMEAAERQFLQRSIFSARSAMRHLSSGLRTPSGCFTESAQHAVGVLCQYVDSLNLTSEDAIV